MQSRLVMVSSFRPPPVSAIGDVSARNASSRPAPRISMSHSARGRRATSARSVRSASVAISSIAAAHRAITALHAGQRSQRGAAQARAAAHLPTGRLLLDGGRRAVGDDTSAIQHDDARGQRIGLLEIVRRQQDRARPRAASVADRAPRTGGATRRPCRRSARPGRAGPGLPHTASANSVRCCWPPDSLP